MIQYKYRKQKGLSLIEAAMVLALAAIVVSGVMFYYQSSADNERLNRLSTTLTHIVSTINVMYANHSFNGIDTTVIAKADPAIGKVNEKGNLSLPTGEELYVGSWNGGKEWYFTIYPIPSEMCAQTLATISNLKAAANATQAWYSKKQREDGKFDTGWVSISAKFSPSQICTGKENMAFSMAFKH